MVMRGGGEQREPDALAWRGGLDVDEEVPQGGGEEGAVGAPLGEEVLEELGEDGERGGVPGDEAEGGG